MDLGMGPVRRGFSETRRKVRFLSLPMDGGMVPVRLGFPTMRRNLRRESRPMEGGMAAEMLVYWRVNRVTLPPPSASQ